MLAVEIAKDGHTEALKDVVDVEQRGQHLTKVTNHIVPANGWGPEREEM